MHCKQFCLGLLLSAVSVAGQSSDFQSLFNGRDLSGWDTWLGAREVSKFPFKLWGEWEDVVGLNRDESGVFSVVTEDGAPAIRISGKIWGALISAREYADYHLRLEYKWGEAKYAPRADKPRNTGLLYHSTGDHGAFWSYWMRSAEFEIMLGSTGMWSSVDGVTTRIPTRWDSSLPVPWKRYASDGSESAVGGLIFRVQASADREKPAGQWNRLDLYVLGDQSIHVVNGGVVLTAATLAHDPGSGARPLTRGKLQLQSEGAEVFFRDIEIRPIEALP